MSALSLICPVSRLLCICLRVGIGRCRPSSNRTQPRLRIGRLLPFMWAFVVTPPLSQRQGFPDWQISVVSAEYLHTQPGTQRVIWSASSSATFYGSIPGAPVISVQTSLSLLTGVQPFHSEHRRQCLHLHLDLSPQ
jgi:hypothetical protein